MPEPIPVLLTVRELGQGGCERDLTKLATRIDRSRFEPHVACFHSEGIRADDLRRGDVPILHVPVTSFQSPSALTGAFRMGQYLRRHRIRLVQAFDVPMSIFSAPVARCYRTPVVVTSQLSYRSLVADRYVKLLRFSDRLADAVVVNCRAMHKHMVEEGVQESRIELCYNGIDTDVFYPGPEIRRLPFSERDIVIGVVCALRPEKDLLTLVNAFITIAPEFPQAKLLIVGSGPVLPDLIAQIRSAGLESRCLFEPARPDVAPWLRTMDIFVLPSLSEAFSNALMEAMACGCTPVASNVGGNPELVRENQTGLLFSPGNVGELAARLRLLIQDPGRCKAYADASIQFIEENFTLATYTTRMMDLFTSLMQRKATLLKQAPAGALQRP